VWALVAFQPEAPFELDGSSYPTVADVSRAMRRGSLQSTPTLLVEIKLRPVLVLQDRPRGAIPEYAALKLTRLTKVSSAARRQIRDGRASSYAYLGAGRYGLRHENAIDLTSLVRVHRSAIVNADRIRAIHPWFNGYHVVVLTTGKELRMSRYQHESFTKLARLSELPR